MTEVTIKQTADGFAVTRTFRHWPSAQRALDLMWSINEAAYAPASPGDVRLAMALEAAEVDDLDPHDGRLNLPATATGD